MTHAEKIIRTVDQWLRPLGYMLDDYPKPKHLFNRVREFYIYPSSLFSSSSFCSTPPNISSDRLHLSYVPLTDVLKTRPKETRPQAPKTKLRIRIENPSITKACPFDGYIFHIYLPK